MASIAPHGPNGELAAKPPLALHRKFVGLHLRMKFANEVVIELKVERVVVREILGNLLPRASLFLPNVEVAHRLTP